LQAANYHKVDKDSKTFVDRQLKKDSKEVAVAFDKQFGELFALEDLAFDFKKIKREDFVKFIDENFFPIEEGGLLEE
jgi:hypothetical protein